MSGIFNCLSIFGCDTDAKADRHELAGVGVELVGSCIAAAGCVTGNVALAACGLVTVITGCCWTSAAAGENEGNEEDSKENEESSPLSPL